MSEIGGRSNFGSYSSSQSAANCMSDSMAFSVFFLFLGAYVLTWWLCFGFESGFGGGLEF